MSKNNETNKNGSKSYLSKDSGVALREMIRITKALCDMADQEMQALVTNNMLPFAFLQMEKEKLVERYQLVADEFRKRLEDFRSSDPALIGQLEKLQNDLKEKSVANNAMVDQIRRRSLSSTMESLFVAQELGQRVEWPQKESDHAHVNGTGG
ncbi:MAG: hypothetical protein H6858_01265 [Rhodospirillales bacterium]|nr:hypothetical protein [Alphaproteobacteria bacterium]MCB1841055.1 hypothetical protein [Alphaproteobacteria bacterium]MCB9976210.1 hypothetical protein [Rhodospirillales bacterium]